MINQKLISRVLAVVLLCAAFINSTSAQSIDEIRWKSESEVRAILGDPLNISQPTGTHATYTLWQYENVTVAFSNGKAFHLFVNDSLRKFELTEERPEQ